MNDAGASEASTSPRRSTDGLPIVVLDRANISTKAPSWSFARQIVRRARFVPLVIGLVALGGIIGLYYQPPGLQFVFRTLGLTPGGGTSHPIAVPADRPKPTDSPVAARRFVVGLGKLVPAGDVVVVAPPFGAGDGRIAKLNVSEGDRVVKGAVLALMDNEAQLKAIIVAAGATVSAREASLEQTLASVRASGAEARAALERAQATVRNAERDMQRIEQLFRKGYASEAAFQQKRTVRDEVAREVEKAQATLSRWESADPAQQPDAIVARRNIEAAKADLVRAERDLDKAYVTAPSDGTVLTLHARAGEKPGAQGLMTFGNIDKMTVEVEVYQAQISSIAIGDPVTVTAEALGKPLTGVVTRIGLEVGRQILTDPSPAANTDARVVKVFVALEPDSSKLAQRFTNLLVIARIAVQSRP